MCFGEKGMVCQIFTLIKKILSPYLFILEPPLTRNNTHQLEERLQIIFFFELTDYQINFIFIELVVSNFFNLLVIAILK